MTTTKPLTTQQAWYAAQKRFPGAHVLCGEAMDQAGNVTRWVSLLGEHRAQGYTYEQCINELELRREAERPVREER